jgi:hypothetical protein
MTCRPTRPGRTLSRLARDGFVRADRRHLPAEKLFERVVFNLATALEDGLDRALDPNDRRVILCHRGSLVLARY